MVLCFGLLYAKLIFGPISVAFLAEPIQNALNAELRDYSVGIEGAALHRSERGGIELRMRNLRVYDARGGKVAEAGWAGVEVGMLGLMALRVTPVRIDLIEPRVVVSRDDQGRFSMSVEAQEGAAPAHSDAIGRVGSGINPKAAGTVADHATQRPAIGNVPLAEPDLDIGPRIAAAMEQMRQATERGMTLEAVGLRNAVVVLDTGGQQTTWRVPSFQVDFTQKQKRRIVSGKAEIVSAGEAWMAGFRVEAAEKSRTISIATEVSGLTPSRIAHTLPMFGTLAGIDVPLTGKGTFELSIDGEPLEGKLAIDLGKGRLGNVDTATTSSMESGRIEARYDAATDRFDLAPSTLTFGGGSVTLVGNATRDAAGVWGVQIASSAGTLAANRPGAPSLPIEQLNLRGRVGGPVRGAIIDRAVLRVAGSEMAIAGQLGGGAHGEGVDLTGQIGAMPVSVLQALAPRNLPAAMHDLITNKLASGIVVGRHLRITSEPGKGGTAPPILNFSMTLEGQDLQVEAMKGLPILEIPRLLMRTEGSSVEITIPDAHMTTAGGRRVGFKGSRLTTASVDGSAPLAELVTRAQGPLPAVLEILDREPLALLKGSLPPLSSIDGKIDSQIRLTLPIGPTLKLSDARLDTKTRLTDGRVKDIVGTHDISGATLAIDGNERGVDVKGELLLAGVVVKVAGQWQVAPPDGRQSPIKFATRLDGAYRVQLGMDLEHMVAGDVPVEVTLQPGAGDMKVSVAADLTGAEVTLGDLQWRKPAGRPAKLDFDVVKGQAAKTLELQNFRVVGDDIAIEGTVGIGPDNKAREYVFPQFSLNVVTNLSVAGRLRPDRVWDVTARGKTYDARELFRSFYVFGASNPIVPKNRPGIDLDAEIDAAIGANDAALRRVRIRMQQRAEKMVALDLTGTMGSGHNLVAVVKPDPSQPRTLQVTTTDAGEALKLIGFYSSMIGGSATLDVALDGRGAAEKIGQVRIRNFRVLGDPIVAEVLQNADNSGPSIDQPGRARRRVVREQFEFEQLTAAVSAGNGQLALEDVVVKGPLIGASLRGKIDFRSQRMQLGGTYVPLAGLNRALSDVPLLGLLLTGTRGEGVFGITFAVDGPIAQPNVIVNPLSLVTIGLLRDIFQMAPENPRITPKAEPKPIRSGGPQIRAMPPTTVGNAASPPTGEPEVIDGWSAKATTVPPKKSSQPR